MIVWESQTLWIHVAYFYDRLKQRMLKKNNLFCIITENLEFSIALRIYGVE